MLNQTQKAFSRSRLPCKATTKESINSKLANMSSSTTPAKQPSIRNFFTPLSDRKKAAKRQNTPPRLWVDEAKARKRTSPRALKTMHNNNPVVAKTEEERSAELAHVAEVKAQFPPLEVVWAKYSSYPAWPGIVW